MPDEGLDEPTLDEQFATSVAHGRMFQGELLGLAQRAAERAPQPPAAEAPPLPRLMLRLDRVEPGDVLLSHGGKLESDAIATLSGGAFSHAALWIDPLTTLESDGGLIGPKRARSFGSAKLGTEHIVLGEIVGAPAACTVYRHAGMSSIPVERFAQALQAEMHESYGKDYSEYYRLVMLARLPVGLSLANSLMPLAAEATRAWERRYASDKIHGAFCSELVARFFQRLGLPLFDQERPPEHVSPNDLARSALQPVAGAVVESDLLHDVRHDGSAIEDVYFQLGDTLVKKRREQRGTERAVEQLEETSRSLEQRNQQQTVQMAAVFQQQTETVLDILRTSSSLGQTHLMRRALHLSDQCASLAPALFKVWKADLPEREEMQKVYDAWSRFGNSVLRCGILLSSWQLKWTAKGDSRPLGAFTRFQLRRKRKRLLKQAREHLAARSALQACPP